MYSTFASSPCLWWVRSAPFGHSSPISHAQVNTFGLEIRHFVPNGISASRNGQLRHSGLVIGKSVLSESIGILLGDTPFGKYPANLEFKFLIEDCWIGYPCPLRQMQSGFSRRITCWNA